MTQTVHAAAWQQQIADQLAQIGVPDDTTHLVVHLPDTGDPALLDLADSEAAGIVAAEDYATKVEGGDVSVVPIDQIQPLITTTDEDAETVDDTDVEVQPTAESIDTPDETTVVESTTGQFALIVGGQRPAQHKLSIGGKIEVDRELLKGDGVIVEIRDGDRQLVAAAAGTVSAIGFVDKTDKEGFITTTREQKITLEAD